MSFLPSEFMKPCLYTLVKALEKMRRGLLGTCLQQTQAHTGYTWMCSSVCCGPVKLAGKWAVTGELPSCVDGLTFNWMFILHFSIGHCEKMPMLPTIESTSRKTGSCRSTSEMPVTRNHLQEGQEQRKSWWLPAWGLWRFPFCCTNWEHLSV